MRPAGEVRKELQKKESTNEDTTCSGPRFVSAQFPSDSIGLWAQKALAATTGKHENGREQSPGVYIYTCVRLCVKRSVAKVFEFMVAHLRLN
uniref:Uncharacterized protein n=1 Tax=Ascaris lumbricoides TaxID=6252 RepID=A0A0M3HPK0_ASCLU